MMRHPRRLSAWALVPLLCVATVLAGARDVRLADAVQYRNTQVVLSLLRQHVDVNVPQADGATALHWAAHLEDVGTAELLIRAGANVNVRNDHGVTPLSLACTNGSAALIEALLKSGADPNGTVRVGETPLMLAARTGHEIGRAHV